MAVSRIFAGTCVLQILFALTLIILGYMFKDDCPADRYVPMHLIVIGGLFICLVPLLTLAAVQFESRNGIVYVLILIYSTLVIACLFVMILYGTIRVWNVDRDFEHPTSQKYCNSSFYEAARGLLVAIFLWCLLLIYISLNRYSNRPTENHEGANQNLLGNPSINDEGNSPPPNYHSVAISYNKPTFLPNHDRAYMSLPT